MRHTILLLAALLSLSFAPAQEVQRVSYSDIHWVPCDPLPYAVDFTQGPVMVPARAVAEALQGDLALRDGQLVLTIAGAEHALPGKPLVRDGRSFIALPELARLLGGSDFYCPSARQARLEVGGKHYGFRLDEPVIVVPELAVQDEARALPGTRTTVYVPHRSATERYDSTADYRLDGAIEASARRNYEVYGRTDTVGYRRARPSQSAGSLGGGSSRSSSTRRSARSSRSSSSRSTGGSCPQGGGHVGGKTDRNGRLHCAKCGRFM